MCWTESLARWLEHNREGAFSYKSNQHWDSPFRHFFFQFSEKAFVVATWEPLDVWARALEVGDSFKQWNWPHRDFTGLSKAWRYKGTGIDSIQQHRDLWFMNHFHTYDVSKPSSSPHDVDLFASILPIRKPSFSEIQRHTQVHVARKRWCWN